MNTILISACAAQVVAAAAFASYTLRPQWAARFASNAFLIRHSLWNECDGEPMNVWAEELVRRDWVALESETMRDQSKGGGNA